MNSDYKYRHILKAKEKKEFRKMLIKNKPIKEICNKFKVSKRFVKYKYLEFNQNPQPIFFGSKTIPYYTNEMEYGELKLKYKYEEVRQEKPNS